MTREEFEARLLLLDFRRVFPDHLDTVWVHKSTISRRVYIFADGKAKARQFGSGRDIPTLNYQLVLDDIILFRIPLYYALREDP